MKLKNYNNINNNFSYAGCISTFKLTQKSYYDIDRVNYGQQPKKEDVYVVFTHIVNFIGFIHHVLGKWKVKTEK